jgi:hypothetical protein
MPQMSKPASSRRSCWCTAPTAYASKFTGKYEHRVVEGGIGHNLPQEAPQAFAEAIIDAGRY